MFHRIRAIVLIAGAVAAAASVIGVAPLVYADENTRKLPRFVSLRSGEVNLRAGPGQRYPIEWVYRKKGLPVEITAEFDKWRRVRDHDGAIGWVHQALLSGRRTVLITGEPSMLRKAPEDGAKPLARIAPGVIGELDRCEDGWCRLAIGKVRGWLPQRHLWGIYPAESFDD